jgi:phenylalanyl-tRNA synthetase beta chain
MPSLEVSLRDMEKLIGATLSPDELQHLVTLAKCDVDSIVGDSVKLEAKDTNRPDLWSAEGIAREIRFRVKKPRFPKYKTSKSRVEVVVDKSVRDVRPFTACAVITNLHLGEAGLSQMIQLQEKVASNYGGGRKEVAIGVYDLDKIRPPINYTTVDPDGIRFVPLDFEEELTPREILEKHPKGKEFGHLLAGVARYPIFVDSVGEVMSVPPIINSNFSGKVTENTRNAFIECSGFHLDRLSVALNVVSTALAERGAEIGAVKVRYGNKVIVTPDFTPGRARVDLVHFGRISDLTLSPSKACDLLRKSGYSVIRRKKDRVEVLYPAYRHDIMHERDLMEDMLISYGYDKIKPQPLKLPTVGASSRIERFSSLLCELMIGLGFQQVMSYTLTNKAALFAKMKLREEPVIELENPVSSSWNVFRNWMLPCVVDFLSSNAHVDYPQNVFEIGDVIVPDQTRETRVMDKRKLACARASAEVGYQDMASVLDAFLSSLGCQYELRPGSHPSFIEGRVADVILKGAYLGVLGEISPEVLEAWNIEVPVSAFEIDVSSLHDILPLENLG